MEHGDGSAIACPQLTMLYAGGPEGKDQVEEFIAAVGFVPVFVGPIRYARNLEVRALCPRGRGWGAGGGRPRERHRRHAAWACTSYLPR